METVEFYGYERICSIQSHIIWNKRNEFRKCQHDVCRAHIHYDLLALTKSQSALSYVYLTMTHFRAVSTADCILDGRIPKWKKK